VGRNPATGHRRIPEILASLEIAGGLAVNWFRHCGAITDPEAATILQRIKGALSALAELQTEQVKEANPARQFCEILAELFAKRSVYCQGRRGDEPPGCQQLGWEQRSVYDRETGEEIKLTPARGATQIGWADDEWLYLSPRDSFRLVTQFLNQAEQTLGATSESLHRALAEAGLIEVRHSKESRRTVVVLLDGAQRRVLKLRRSAVIEEALGDE
jgi:hypothetical protein